MSSKEKWITLLENRIKELEALIPVYSNLDDYKPLRETQKVLAFNRYLLKGLLGEKSKSVPEEKRILH